MKESEIRIELGSFMIRQGSENFDIGYISSSGSKPHCRMAGPEIRWWNQVI